MGFIVYLLARGILLPFQVAPLPLSRAMGRVLGRVWFVLDFHHRKVVLRNLRLALGAELGERELRRLRRRVFDGLGTMVAEFAWGLRLRPEDVAGRIAVAGIDDYRAARARSEKCVLIGAHLACFEWGTAIPVVTGVRMFGVGRSIANRRLDAWMTRRRERFGVEVWHPKGVVKRFGEEVAGPADIGLMVDQRARRSGADAPFFGHPAPTMIGAAVLALRYGFPIVPLRFTREPQGFGMRFEEALPLPEGGETEENVRALTAAINAKVEAWVRERPEEWFWVHERWG